MSELGIFKAFPESLLPETQESQEGEGFPSWLSIQLVAQSPGAFVAREPDSSGAPPAIPVLAVLLPWVLEAVSKISNSSLCCLP